MKEYQHIERFGTDEVDGIELGECYVFPKIDGTCSSVWIENGELKAGSRHRELTLEKDNAGFYAYVKENENLKSFFQEYTNCILYGEWLVKHTVGTYRDDAWREFYVFDVMIDNETGMDYLHYSYYKIMLEKYGIEYIPPLAIITDGSPEQFNKSLEKNTYLIKDGQGIGEGICIKRYDYRNKYGRRTWAKIVTSEFKEKHTKAMGAPEINGELTYERRFIDDFCTEAFVQKEFEKIKLEGWSSKTIPKLLGVVYHTLVTESIWEAVKKYKNPKLDFGIINRMCVQKVKSALPNIF